MANSRTPQPERSVTRLYRAAVRLGEDFVTLEEAVTLPIDASDEDVQRAVDLGWRIFEMQRAAAERQIALIREGQPAPSGPIIRDPEAPASEKQRNYISALQDDLNWNSDQLGAFASDQGVDLVTMNKGQASAFIDTLKRVAEERPSYQAHSDGTSHDASAAPAKPMTERQRAILIKIAHERGLDLDEMIAQRFATTLDALLNPQASELITEIQRSTQRSGRRAEAAL